MHRKKFLGLETESKFVDFYPDFDSEALIVHRKKICPISRGETSQNGTASSELIQ